MDKELILKQISENSLRKAAKNLRCGYGTLRYWINLHGIELPKKYSNCACCGNSFGQRAKGNPRKLCEGCREKFSSLSHITRKKTVRYSGSRRKAYVVRLLGGKCASCGYDKSSAALEFHHIDPSSKEIMINSKTLMTDDFSKIEQELLKCKLLCRNCHAEQHFPHCSNWKDLPNFW